jgi:long-chain acyl-CoA synthetase
MAIETHASDTFAGLLLRNSSQHADSPAFREKRRGIWRTMTWQMLADEAAALGAALSERGLQRGGYVAFLGDNRPRLYAAICATHRVGAIAVPLYQDATAEEIASAIQGTEVTHVFAENQEQVDKWLEILPRCPSIRGIVYDKDRGMRHYKQPQLVSYNALLEEGHKALASKRDALDAAAAQVSGQDAAFLLFTSGTTGPFKGVILTHASLIDRARVAAAADGLSHTDIAMAYLPPGWIGQNFFGYALPLLTGYCVCCPESSDTMLSDIREVGPTYFLATPWMLDMLLSEISKRMEDAGWISKALYNRGLAAGKRMNADRLAGKSPSLSDRFLTAVCNVLIYGSLRDILGLSKIRVAYVAGDAVDPALVTFFRALGVNLKQLYGSTETGFFVAMQRNDDVKPDTVGPLAEGVEIKFTSQREILVRSPGLFKEYIRDPQSTQQAKSAEGWFHTGDVGYLGEDGHLRIVERAKYLGAMNDGTLFTPKQIENRLKFVPYIREAVAIGDKRDMVCVLIDIDALAVGRWADKREISYTGQADLAAREEVHVLIGESISKVNAELGQSEFQVRRFLILPNGLSADDGMVTRMGKLRRAVIADRYRSLIDAMYAGRGEASFDTGDPATGTIQLAIKEAKVVAPASSRRAA